MANQHIELKEQEVKTYRIEGLSCTNCAAKFERNVQQLPNVSSAQINFGAAKLYVRGEVSIEQLEEAGAFDHLKVRNDHEAKPANDKTWDHKQNIKLYVAISLLIMGWLSQATLGESHILTMIPLFLSIIIGGYRLFIKGFKNLISLHFDMNTLMTIAIIGAAAIGEWSEGATVVILFAISEALERFSMDKARRSIQSLMDIAPREAVILRHNKEMQIPVEDIGIGDIMLVKPGQKLAMDGVVINGFSAINQSAITGESIPVTKTINDEVYAGTLNEQGLLEVKVTKKAKDTTLSKIIYLVEEAQAQKAGTQSFIDRFAKYYTPIIMLIALLIMIIPPLFFDAVRSKWIYEGLAVLVIGCPCALVISTPISIVTAIGNAAKQGVLIKGGLHLEKASSLDIIAFDKTGTLTTGKPTVVDIISAELTTEEVLSITAAIEKGAYHPLASAIIAKANEQKCKYNKYRTEQFESIVGKGVSAKVNNKLYYVGNIHWIESLLPGQAKSWTVMIDQLQENGNSVVILADDHKILGLIAIIDSIRENAKQAINQLQQIGLQSIMLTGDHEVTAKVIGEQLKLTKVYASLLPEDKLHHIKQLQQANKQVGMIGDGVNDAPALAAASLGIAMGGAGSDTALETADIVLMSDDLSKLPYTIQLSKKTLTIIKQNIGFSLFLKLIALLLVVPGWLTLWIAILADMGATLLVMLNSLRLLKVKAK